MGEWKNGYIKETPYEAIHVRAEALTVPQALTDHSKPRRKLKLPVCPTSGSQLFKQVTKYNTTASK